MGALAALFTTVKGGEYVAFLSFAMLMVLDIELFTSFFKTKKPAQTLFLFQLLFQGLLGAIGIFVVQTYLNYVETYIIPVLIAVGSVSISAVLDRKFKNRKKSLIIFVVVLMSLYIVYFVTLFFLRLP